MEYILPPIGLFRPRMKTTSWMLRSLLLLGILSGSWGHEKMKNIYSWKSLEFAFPSEEARDAAIHEGRFIPGKLAPIDTDVYVAEHKKPIVFITIPRFQEGVPVTLGYVSDDATLDGNPLIVPYPNWEYNTLGNCDSITSVYRIQVDKCGRLWVLDTGKHIEEQICPPQLLVFCLKSNKLLSQYKFSQDFYKDTSIFVTPIVDTRGPKCQDTFVYIADVAGFALIVYDHNTGSAWKIVNNLFYPYPTDGTFHIHGDTFDLMDGILGLALSPIKPNGDRILYFHSLASRVESWVSTSIIRNATLFHDNPEAAPRSFKPFALKRETQSAAEAMDRNGVLFFGLLSDISIGCWNSKHYPQYGGNNIEVVAKNQERLQFPSGMKVITDTNGRQELWTMTSSFQRVMIGTINPNETNFRIEAGYVDELVRGTKCDVASLNVQNSRVRPGTHLGK
uniref:Yellow-like protein n=1 Tax=Ampulex compressa TaxID=860918 RepID=A0A1W6EW31_AMPCP|nr:yellow-like protein [Ampulex compressa]